MNKTQHGRIPRTVWTLYVFLMVINGVAPAASTLAADVAGVAGGFDNAAASPHRGNERILSRKRRYLIFPQGSSLQLGELVCGMCVCEISWNWDQMAFNPVRSCWCSGVLIKIARASGSVVSIYFRGLGTHILFTNSFSLLHCTSAVYDMVYPILDKANVAYIGITGALAYQLPYEPINIDAVFRRPEPSPASDNSDDRISAGNKQMPQPAPTNPTGNGNQRPPVDRYYNQNQDQYYRSPSVKTTGGTYYIGSPDSPPDRLSTAASPNRGEPGVVDKSTNKMDYYFSYADRLMQTLNTLNRRKIDPWKRVTWSAEQSPMP